MPEQENQEKKAKFTKIQNAIGEYSEDAIAYYSKELLKRFDIGEVKLEKPDGYTDTGD